MTRNTFQFNIDLYIATKKYGGNISCQGNLSWKKSDTKLNKLYNLLGSHSQFSILSSYPARSSVLTIKLGLLAFPTVDRSRADL